MSSDKTPKTNTLGLSRKDYMGAASTLCTGCGHDSITNHIISAFFQSGVNPYDVAKMSGIGCSSKTPTYFMNRSHGFNSIHGRMAPVATGAKVANKKLITIGVSGDGDTASIGMGGFVHLIRRNVPMVYIVENNGVYGLTKGQFSATADLHSTLKSGEVNLFQDIDLCALAIELGCSFVARSFSGDAKQLVPLLDAAIRHPGTAFIDVISPCITFANHEASTKSYNYVRDHKVPLQELGFIQPQEQIKVDYQEGQVQTIELADGSKLTLKKLVSQEHDLANPTDAIKLLHEARSQRQILTGLFYLQPKTADFISISKLSHKPLTKMDESDCRPSPELLSQIMQDFR